ncbi:MAG: glycosyltransferase family 4 protein [Vicinamibacteria bacterium]|nr:glycosyltransferase family 4 protein [Vicinamibacteria bacterium]
MKLLIVSNLFPPEVQGGYEILCAQVTDELRFRGHDVHVLTTVGADTPARTWVHRRLRLTAPFPEPVKRSRLRSLRVHRENAAITRELISAVRPDQIFIWSQLRLTLGCAEAAEGSGIPVAYTFNDDHPAGFLPRRANGTLRSALGAGLDRIFSSLTLSARRLNRTTCISATLKSVLLEKGLAISQSKVIYQGIPIERFPPALDRPLSPTLRILYAGQLHEYKGVHTLLEAAAMISRERTLAFELSVAGDGPSAYKARLKDLAALVGAPVRFLGRVPHQDLPALYRAHDIFVFPSIWREPFGLTHLEAMASGTPVVSTTEGGPGEFLEDNHNALTFPAGDAEALARALLRFANDNRLSRSLARNARQMVETRFTLGRYVTDLEVFLEESRS